MKWLLVAVAFALGAAITWLLTVRRVSLTVPAVADGAGDPTEGANGMGSGAAHVEGVAGDSGREAEPVEDDAGDGLEDASRFGGERTSSTVSPRVGWDDDAEDIDALLPEEEKSQGQESGEQTADEQTADEQQSDRHQPDEQKPGEQKPEGV
ncbi:hypothetical protein [Terrabacter sp. BE26]|uniref:channel accessory protein ArfC n=1 Tax=Terrabacter sp. BE26 TaxID=2898152 RepID=UPI0035BE9319